MSSSDKLMDYDSRNQFQSLLSQLKSNWPVLPSGMWNSSCIQAALRVLNNLRREGKASDLLNLVDYSQAIEKIISDVYEENMQPDVEEIKTLNRYLEQLTQAIEASDYKQQTQSSFSNVYEVLYLPRNQVSGDLIFSTIEKNGWMVKQLSDIDSLCTAILQNQAEIVLIDTDYLAQIEAIKNALATIANEKKPELIFISNHCDVEIRLEILRVGATQCFSEPISVNELVSSIKEAISPELKPHYRVLVVDDDKAQSKYTCKLLKKGGFETLTIADPMNVLSAVQSFQPDLILMDLYMPGANGIELTQLIRARKNATLMPIVFLSGEGDVNKKILALYSGADDFLTKPISQKHLVATVLTRIKRAKEMVADSNRYMVDGFSGLPSRRHFLDELDRVSIRLIVEREQCGLFVISVAGENSVAEEGYSHFDNSLVARIADVLGPVLGKRDTLSRIGSKSLGVLVERAFLHDIEHLGTDIYRQVYDELVKGRETDLEWGIGLVVIDPSDVGSYRTLEQAEKIAKAAIEQEIDYYLQNEVVRNITMSHDVPDDLLRERVRTALKSGFVEFHEQRYQALIDDSAIVEQVPRFVSATGLSSEMGNIYQSASQFNGMGMLNRLVCRHAVRKLGEMRDSGLSDRILIWMSGLSVHDQQLIPFLQSELRKLHVVGTGLIIEFDLPSIASDLKLAKRLFDELSSLGMTVLLGNFVCNDASFKVLAYLQANAVRLHPSLLCLEDEKIDKIVASIRALNAFTILPKIDTSENMNLHWLEVADYIQATRPALLMNRAALRDLDAVD